MSELRIITNNHVREILYWEQLTDAEREEFDWINPIEDCHSFFRYKGWCYCLSDFMRIQHHPDKEFSSWHGYMSDSFFSGILVKYPEDSYSDGIIVGWYMS